MHVYTLSFLLRRRCNILLRSSKNWSFNHMIKKKKDATLRRRTTSWSDVQSEPSKSSLSWCGPQQVTVQDLLDLVLIMGFLPRTASPLVRVWRRCCPRLLNWTTLWPKSQVLDTNAATYRPVFYILFFLAAFWHEFKVKLKKTPKKTCSYTCLILWAKFQPPCHLNGLLS